MIYEMSENIQNTILGYIIQNKKNTANGKLG